MSCKHGNWGTCEECEAEDALYESGVRSGRKEADALIRQMLETIENSSPYLDSTHAWKSETWLKMRSEAITAARARLGECRIDELNSNARLIAAAPDLLEAIKMLVEKASVNLPILPEPDLRDVGTKPQEIKDFLRGYATSYATSVFLGMPIEKARAAIAKAEGGAA